MYYWFHQSFYMAKAFPFIGGWLADRLFGDPEGWPHPVVGFGKVISLGEKTLNKGNDRAVKGGIMALILVVGTFTHGTWCRLDILLRQDTCEVGRNQSVALHLHRVEP